MLSFRTLFFPLFLITGANAVYWISRFDPQSGVDVGGGNWECVTDQSTWTLYNSDVPPASGGNHCNSFQGETASTGTLGSIGTCHYGDYSYGWWFCPLSDGTGRLYFAGDNFYRTCLPNPSYQVSACICSILPGCWCTESLVMTCAETHPIKKRHPRSLGEWE